MINENADKNYENIGSDDDDQDEATENECEDLVNVLQINVTLIFKYVEEMSEEEEIGIKNINEIAEHDLDEKLNGLKKVDGNLLKDLTMKVNATISLKPIDSLKLALSLWEEKQASNQTKEEERFEITLEEMKNVTINTRTTETYQHLRAGETWRN